LKILVAISLAIAAIVAAVMIYRAEPDTLDQRVKAEQARESEMKHPSPSVVLSIRASTPSPLPTAAGKSVRGLASQEYSKARSLKTLYDRLSAPGATATGDDKYVLYKILAGCARRSDSKTSVDPAARQQALDKRRKDLEAQIPLTNPDRQKRLDAFDAISQRCAGMENVETSKAELDKLLADAAAMGDPKAQARLAFPQMAPMQGQNPNMPQRAAMNLSDDQFHTMQSAIASRDPDAIIIAGMALSNTYDDAILQVGADRGELQARASMEAWRLVACEYGMECGPENQELQTACFAQGRCAATTVPDQVFYYDVSPYEAQLIDQYRQVFRNAVANNDWSGLTLARQPNTSSSRFYFGIGP
jgi:hypothetical protein